MIRSIFLACLEYFGELRRDPTIDVVTAHGERRFWGVGRYHSQIALSQSRSQCMIELIDCFIGILLLIDIVQKYFVPAVQHVAVEDQVYPLPFEELSSTCCGTTRMSNWSKTAVEHLKVTLAPILVYTFVLHCVAML